MTFQEHKWSTYIKWINILRDSINYNTHHKEDFFVQVRKLHSPAFFVTGITVSDSRVVFSFSVVYFDFTSPFRAVLSTASVLSLHWFPRCVPHLMHLVRSVGFIRVHRSQCHCRTEAIEPILLESWLFYHEISFGLQIFRASWSTILILFCCRMRHVYKSWIGWRWPIIWSFLIVFLSLCVENIFEVQNVRASSFTLPSLRITV